MSKQKHTPGPWEIGEASWNEYGEVRYTLHGIFEAKVADCLLIGAAPDLLIALKDLVSFITEDAGLDDEHNVSAARAAIAKAEGR